MPFSLKQVEGVFRYAKEQVCHLESGRDDLIVQALVAYVSGERHVMIDNKIPFTIPEVVEEIGRLSRGIEFFRQAAKLETVSDLQARMEALNKMWFRS